MPPLAGADGAADWGVVETPQCQALGYPPVLCPINPADAQLYRRKIKNQGLFFDSATGIISNGHLQ